MDVQLVGHHPGVVTVGVTGEIDHATATAFQDGTLALLGPVDRHLVLDFSQVRFWDSPAIRALAALAQQLSQFGGRLVVAGAPKLGRVLELAGLDGHIATAANSDVAVAQLQQTPSP